MTVICVAFRGSEDAMPGPLDPFMEQQYTGEIYQPTMQSTTFESTGSESPEEEPPLLVGNETFLYIFPYIS